MRFVTNRMLNPLTRPLLRRGLWPRTQALIETTGRTSGQPRTVPVGNGLRGDAFWIVTEHGYGADYVKNIQHDPRMRVQVGRHWHHGTAHILADDDPRQRLRWLGRPVNDALLLLIGTQQLTIRVDLEPTARFRRTGRGCEVPTRPLAVMVGGLFERCRDARGSGPVGSGYPGSATPPKEPR